jgi:Transglycosylase SLT domain
MKTLTIALLLSALGGGLIGLQATYEPGPHPGMVLARAQTPDSIKVEVHAEHIEKFIRHQTRIARMLYLAHGCNDTFAELTARTAYEYRLPVRLVAGVVIVESTCRPRVVSSEGAVGLMQVSLIWHISRRQLEDPVFNLRKGSEILADYTHRYGLREGLHHYNGMGMGCPACDGGYTDKVLSVAGLENKG